MSRNKWSKVMFVGMLLSAASHTRGAEVRFQRDHNVCERLLQADLSGYYVFTNQALKKSSLVQLRRLGDSPAYTVSEFRFRLPQEGVRKMMVERQATGWLVEDPMFPERRATVMNLEQEGQDISVRFEDFGDTTGFFYRARLAFGSQDPRGPQGVQGDILRPDRLDFQFYHGLDYSFQTTRLDLDQAFDSTVSHFLKTVLASRLGTAAPPSDDLLILVDLKTPMTITDTVGLFGTEFVYPFEDLGNRDVRLKTEKFQRYVVPKNMYEFLESSPRWVRRWEVAQITAIPTRLLNTDFVKRVVDVGLALEKARRTRDESRDQLQALSQNPSLVALTLTTTEEPSQSRQPADSQDRPDPLNDDDR